MIDLSRFAGSNAQAWVRRGVSILSFLAFVVYGLEQAENAFFIRSDAARRAICGATSERDLATVDRLRRRGVSLDVPCYYEEKTPVSIAAHTGDAEAVEYLLVWGADPHKPNRWGQTPLYFAEQELAAGEQDWSGMLSYTRIVRLLKEAGGKDNTRP